MDTRAPRRDLDILVRGTPTNAPRVFRALAAFGAPLAAFEVHEGAAFELRGRRIPVIGLQALLTNKRAAGRPQDLADVAALSARLP